MKYQIEIKVDANDADYMTEVSEITESQLLQIKPLIEAIKKFKPYVGTRADWKYPFDRNYHVGEGVRIDLGEKEVEDVYPEISPEVHELFREFCPYGEYGFHTVESIYVYPAIVKTRLL